jgi:anhydro-N-acetylmuramic acid kinase
MGKMYSVIGLMSGTSMDGVDIAYCEFNETNNSWFYRIIYAETSEYDEYWKNQLSNADKLSAAELNETNINYGHFLGRLSKSFISKYNIAPYFIASHGHTVFHRPENGITLQIGSGAALAAEVKIPVICDFRSLDVALGGQGAPLVPIGDKLLFGDYNACLNIGGFANISYEKNDRRIAYDICPANIVLNYYAEKLGKPFDANGDNARKGKTDIGILNKLNEIEFYKAQSPKSLGKEWVKDNFLKITEKSEIVIEDILCTLTEHISYQIAREIENNELKKVLFTGGGTFNKFLIESITSKCKSEIIIPDIMTINFKEALIFAFLGVLRYRNEVNCLCSVTGACRDNCGGAIYHY